MPAPEEILQRMQECDIKSSAYLLNGNREQAYLELHKFILLAEIYKNVRYIEEAQNAMNNESS